MEKNTMVMCKLFNCSTKQKTFFSKLFLKLQKIKTVNKKKTFGKKTLTIIY